MSRIPRSNFVSNVKSTPILTASTPLEISKKNHALSKTDVAKLRFTESIDLSTISDTLDFSRKNIENVNLTKPKVNKIVPKTEPLKSNNNLKRAASQSLSSVNNKQMKINPTEKILPHDYKARYNELNEKYKNLQNDYECTIKQYDECIEINKKDKASLSTYIDANNCLTTEVESLKTINSKFEKDLEKAEIQLKRKEELENLIINFEKKLDDCAKENRDLSSQLIETKNKFTFKSNEYDSLKNKLNEEIGRNLELNSAIEESQLKLSSCTSEISFLKTKQNILEQKVSENNVLIVELKSKNDELISKISELETNYNSIQNSLECKTKECDKFSNLYYSEVEKCSNLSSDLISKKAEIVNLTQQVLDLTKNKEYLQIKNQEQSVEIENQNKKIEDLQKRIESMYENEKSLRNSIQDLKGHIRVYCRVKPIINEEKTKTSLNLDITDACTVEIEKTVNSTSGLTAKQTKSSFKFDGVFSSTSSQSDIFVEVSSLVQSALDGYNVCIFAYGQTGSGKTFTMEGDNISNNMGIIPRAIDMIFSSLPELNKMGWEFKISASFLEIYNENIYDLLDSNRDQVEHAIKMIDGKSSDVYVSNLKEEFVTTREELNKLLCLSQKNRQTAATLCNERSSRSHSVTKIKFVVVHEKRREKYHSTLNFVDLAGSESGKTSQRMEETKSINKSLSELSKVILALQSKQTHVPYRNSKLTYLLMPSLGGNSKTLMLVNVSQLDDCYNETLNSLRFAANVNSCRNGVAKKNISLL